MALRLPTAVCGALVLSSMGAVDLGGFYTDPAHYISGTWAGTRMMSNTVGEECTETVTVIGSDDGFTFWTLSGAFTDLETGTLEIDFSPKGGPSNLAATAFDSNLTFSDGNAWAKVSSLVALDSSACQETSTDVGGFFTDPNHYEEGTLSGTRMISDIVGDASTDAVTLIGSDDGDSFWTVSGVFTDKVAGAMVVDFSPKGGPASFTATFANDNLTFQDGNAWSKQTLPECTTNTFLMSSRERDVAQSAGRRHATVHSHGV